MFEGGGGGGGLTWPLILRIFGMVSITFFFAPPSVRTLNLISVSLPVIPLFEGDNVITDSLPLVVELFVWS